MKKEVNKKINHTIDPFDGIVQEDDTARFGANSGRPRRNRKNPANKDKPIAANVLYCEIPTDELKELIRIKASERKSPSAGRDLQEMKLEYRRRMFKAPKASKRKVDKADYTKVETPEEFKDRDRSLRELMRTEYDKQRPALFKQATAYGGLTPKQEKFCQVLVASGSFEDAYNAAEYGLSNKTGQKSKTEARVRGKTLYYNNKKIFKRVQNLKEEVMRRMAWDAEKVLDKIAAVYEQSMSNEDFTNANRSMEAIARHLGMFVDKSESKIKMSSFSDSDNEDKVQNDIEKLADIVGLKVVNGGKE